MATLQHVYSAPVARAIRARAAVVSATAATIASPPPRALHADRRVLLGMSEAELQQPAIDFGQQKYRGRQLDDLLYKTKAKEIQDFSHLPQAFRDGLREAGWRVGRLPVHRAVPAADRTIKLTTCSQPETPRDDSSKCKGLSFRCNYGGTARTIFWKLIAEYPLNILSSRCLSGISDGKVHAAELAELLHGCGRRYHVNLIPYNPVEGSEYQRPCKKCSFSFISSESPWLFNYVI